MPNGQSGDEKKKGQGFNNLILGNMSSRSGKETRSWITDLTDDLADDLEDPDEPVAQPPASVTPSSNALPAQFSHPSIGQTQVKWVDYLFDLFQQYEVEFNRAVQNAQLKVETERAIITGDLITRMQGSDHHHYSGRLHTRYWTLAIRGNLSHIEGYIIPSDHYIGFERNIAKYTKFFDFNAVFDGELKWGYERGVISYPQLPSVAKRIFGQIIRVAKGEADETERFGFGGTGGANPPANSQSTGEFIAVSLKNSGRNVSPPEYLLKHAGVFEDDQPLKSDKTQAQSPPPAGPAAAPSQNRTPEQPSTPSQAPANAAAPPTPPSPSKGKSGGKTTTKMTAASLQQISNQMQTEVSIPQAFDLLGKAIDSELERLSKAGAKAFESHDFAQGEKLMKRTAKVKSMRDQMFNSMGEWKRILQQPD